MIRRGSRLLAAFVLAISAGAMMSASFDAEARRAGGGRSIGQQSSNVTQQRAPATPPAAANNATRSAAPAAAGAATAGAATAAKSGMSRWLGPIAGIAAGLGIAALLSSLGLGGAFLEFMSSLILIALLAFGIIYIVRKLRGGAARPAMQQGSMHRRSHQPDVLQPSQPVAPAAPVASGPLSAPAQPVDKSWFIPGDFDSAAFLANAKARFIDVQAVWDSGDLEKLREYMTDDLIAEIKPEFLQRSGENVTEVVLLNAELLGIEQVSDGHLASVRFSGMLREARGAEAFRFEEVWNLYKADNAGWLLAGIQQIPVEHAS